MSDDVKITEPTDDQLRAIARAATGTGYYSGGVKALRAVWNAAKAVERMPEAELPELVEEVKRLVREGDRRLRFQLAAKGDQAWADQMLDAIQRLEAAYSKGGADDDPR